VRPLTSREIAQLLSAQLGGMAGFCDPDEIAAALDHFTEFRLTYMRLWRAAAVGDLQALTSQIERLKGLPL